MPAGGRHNIGSAHFRSASLDVDNDDFVPSVFTRVRKRVGHFVHNKECKEAKKGERVKKRYGRRLVVQPVQRQRKQLMVQETETVAEETKAEAFCPQTKCNLSSITNPAGITELSGKKSIVHLRRLITAAGYYRCEKCCQTFTSASLLVKHILLHEGPEESFICEVCGEKYSSRADFTDHQANHPKIELGFLCNVCHQNFSTPQNLKNHKLLHFKGDRGCFKCGVKSCHIHNPSSLRRQAEDEIANEKANKVQTHHIQEQRSPEKTEPSQKKELLKNVVPPSKAPPAPPALLPQLPSHPPSLLCLPVCASHPTLSPSLHEESFICEVCGEKYSSRADFTDHQANHPKIELGFLCNICHQNFSTPQNLKNHKLLHFKGDRGCFKCGVKFCHIHNPSSLRRQAEDEIANEKANKVQTHHIQEQRSPEKTKPSQKKELLKNVVPPSKAPPAPPALLPQLPSHPPILLCLPVCASHPTLSPSLPEESFICEVCGEKYSSRADFTDHQANHPKIELGFLCNICHQNFSTPQNLKNHKLLHFKDDRRCFKCGVKFCHIHNPSSLRRQAEAEVANEKANKVQTHHIQEQRSPEKTEPSQKKELLKNVVPPSKAPPAPPAPPALFLQLPSHPPILVLLPVFASHPTLSPSLLCLSPPHPLPSPSVNMSQPSASEVAHDPHEATSGALRCLTAVDDLLPLTTSPPPQILSSSAEPGKAFVDFDDHDNAPNVACDKARQIQERYDTPEGQTSASADASHDVLSATRKKPEINSSLDDHTPSTPKETDTLTEEETTPLLQSTAASSLSSVTYSTLVTELSKRKPVVLLKQLIPSAGGYQCEKCCQTFTTTSLLVQHMSQHEGKSSVTSESSVTNDTSQADLNDHQILSQLKMELCFPCNICDRLFTTPQKLKRHKLLHVRDGRKCLKCGVIFCRRHNHVAFRPKAEIKVEDEEELPVNTAQSPHSHEKKEFSLSPPPPLPPTSSIPLPKPNVPVVAHKTRKRPPTSEIYRLKSSPEPHSLNAPPLPEPLFFSHQAGSTAQDPEAPFGFSSLPSTMKMFSPECLTSAFFKVQRNYQHIAGNPKPCKIKREVKEEKAVTAPRKPRTKKVQKIAYDFEVIL